MVTDTGQIAQALDVAHALWPDVPRGAALLARLATAGAQALGQDAQARQAAVDALVDFGDAYSPEYVSRMREEWPQ